MAHLANTHTELDGAAQPNFGLLLLLLLDTASYNGIERLAQLFPLLPHSLVRNKKVAEMAICLDLSVFIL